MSRSKELILLAQRIRALSQTGLVYSLSEYDTERYEELSRLSDEITALATGLKPDDVASGYRPAQEYVTPKVDIRAVVFNEKDEILLVREKMDGCWSLPGGWSDVGYSPKEVAAKEVKEETGLDVLPVVYRDLRYLGERLLSIGGVAPVVLGACAAGADPTDVCLL